MDTPRTSREDELVSLLRGHQHLVHEAYSILEEAEKSDEVLRAVVLTSHKSCVNRIPDPDPARIFSLEDIRRVCVKYRLRFLPAACYRGELPTTAVHAVKQLEKRTGDQLGGFRIMAPAKQFKLCDCDSDPMLFVPIGREHFYLVCRWGKDMQAQRAVLGWPVRSPLHLAATVITACAVLAAAFPTELISDAANASWWDYHRFGIFFCILMAVSAATAYGWFAFFGQFSEEAWDSKTFN
jgi:hypothetical protein